MSYKDKNDPRLKAARRKWYHNNKDRQLENQRKKRSELIKWLWNYKKSLSCTDCGMEFKDHPECCDFHHLNTLEKDGNVRDMINSGKNKLLKEIEKCIPLCANCHRKRHSEDLYSNKHVDP